MSKISTLFNNKKDEKDFYIALIVIAVFLIGGFCLSSLFITNESPIIFTDVTPKTSQIEGFIFENDEDEALMVTILKDEKQQEQLDSWLDKKVVMDSVEVTNIATKIDSIVEDIPAIVQMEVPKLTTDITEEKTVIDTSQIEAEKAIEIATIEKEIAEKAKIEAEKLAIEKAKLAKIKSEKEAEKAKATQYNCAIIVGSFQTAKPADDRKAMLIKQGYPAYTFFRKTLKVVGIKQSCNDEEALQAQLKKIRKTFPNAWVLRPE